jgi:hypothetical protein
MKAQKFCGDPGALLGHIYLHSAGQRMKNPQEWNWRSARSRVLRLAEQFVLLPGAMIVFPQAISSYRHER